MIEYAFDVEKNSNLQKSAETYYISAQLGYYKKAQRLLQICAGITNWRKKYYKFAQVLRIGAIITKVRTTALKRIII